MRPPFSVTSASTEAIPAERRLDFWNDYNCENLVGLQTSSLNGEFSARQTNYSLVDLSLAEISGNAHSVQRTPEMISALPQDSIFVCSLQASSAYFVQEGELLTVSPGETIIYDPNKPFMYGFLGDMHQFLIDLPPSDFAARTGLTHDQLPLKLSATGRTEAMLQTALVRTLTDFARQPNDDGVRPLVDHTYTLLHSFGRCVHDGTTAPTSSTACLLVAQNYVVDHLGAPDLSPQTVADAVGVSLRHLNRIFSLHDSSPAEYIWEQRVIHAHADLTHPAQQKTSIGEIAFRWGFSSQSHFSRAIRGRYGRSPTELRPR